MRGAARPVIGATYHPVADCAVPWGAASLNLDQKSINLIYINQMGETMTAHSPVKLARLEAGELEADR